MDRKAQFKLWEEKYPEAAAELLKIELIQRDCRACMGVGVTGYDKTCEACNRTGKEYIRNPVR